jgi:hypothetical protein
MTMTMVEFLKTEAPDHERVVAQRFVESEPLLRVLPMETRAQAVVPFNQQTALPSTTTRAIGESWTASSGTVQPGAEPMKIQGGISNFDDFQVQTGSGARRNTEALGFIESVARNYVRDVIKGDDSSDPRIIRGLQLRLTDGTANTGNLIDEAAGAATITRCLECQRLVDNPTHWLMSKAMRDKFRIAAMNTSVGGYITRDKDSMGENVTVLADLPIIWVDKDATGALILPFTETASTTSIYCVSLSETGMHGIQVRNPFAQDLGLDPTNGTQWNTVVNWEASFMLEGLRSAARYSAITDVAVTL